MSWLEHEGFMVGRQVVEHLLRAGAARDARANGGTPLALAVRTGQQQMVSCLLRAKAEKQKGGWSHGGSLCSNQFSPAAI